MIRSYGLLFLFIAFITATASGQTLTGNIRAVVTNNDGQPIEGVIVTIRSAALLGQSRSVNSNESGVCRFPSIPIGTYSVEAQIAGFDSVYLNTIEVFLGSTATVPILMKLGRAEEVTVVGSNPFLDVRSAGSPTVFKDEMLTNIPSRRRMWVLMQAAPGVTTDYGDSLVPSAIAFGSNRQSNSWNIDGIDVTAPETGTIWWETSPDVIEQIQIIGIGAPAEYGNHTGAVFNVVTKKGSNIFHGAAKYYFQTDALTGQNQQISGSPFLFHRDQSYDFTATLGGPISKDRIWFFGGFEISRDAWTPPGVDPIYVFPTKIERYDFKITGRFRDQDELNIFVHDEMYDHGGGFSPGPYIEDSAVGHKITTSPAWRVTFNSSLKGNLLMELSYAGWWANEIYGSHTDSFEPLHFNYDVFPLEISGGVEKPYDYRTYKHQTNAKGTYFADNFLNSQHDFKFGAQFSYGSADTITALGSNGIYTYAYRGYLYQWEQSPYHYGGTSKDLGLFVDDTVTVNDRLTLNLGLRFDRNRGTIPDYDALEVGIPSIVSVGNFKTTGRTIRGIQDFIRWNLFSPRLGFVWQTRSDARAAFRGSFGVHYDHDVIGNWDSPSPDLPPSNLSIFNSETGQFDHLFQFSTTGPFLGQDIRPPRSLQFSLGYDHQITENSSIGIQYVYKDTKDLVGWQILGGVYTPFEFVDPFTGRQYTLLNIVENPTIRKGNDPGDFPGSENLRYYQKYHGLLLTFGRRFSDNWAFHASYTYSRSTGLIPRMLSDDQCTAFFSSREGSDPNHYVNADGELQGHRPHLFRAHFIFLKLPWDVQTSAAIEFSSGRSYNRQIRVHGMNQGSRSIIMEPNGSYRYSAIQNVDLSIGKRIGLAKWFHASVDAQILNLLNSDQELRFADRNLLNPGDTFVPVAWVQPRRVQVVLGLQF